MRLSLLSLSLLAALPIAAGFGNDQDPYASYDDLSLMQQEKYGVDVSWPIHHPSVRSRSGGGGLLSSLGLGGGEQRVPDLGDRQAVYDEYVAGCKSHYKDRPKACDGTERDRVKMNKAQPSSMQNYTSLGFKKMRAPKKLYETVRAFWDKYGSRQVDEAWPAGNTYVNHWLTPTSMVSFEDRALRGGFDVKEALWSGVRPVLEGWSGESLTPTSLYGIRVYKGGHVLAPHVDRLPLVTSAIVCVAADVDEPWPLEVYSHDGQAYNVTMLPGDMVLYESHTVLHGRPFPMKGRYVANVFIHFEPDGHSARHDKGEGGKKGQDVNNKAKASGTKIDGRDSGDANAKITGKESGDNSVHEEYRKKVATKQAGGHEHFQHEGEEEGGDDNDEEGEEEEEEEEDEYEDTTFETGSVVLHHAAAAGDVAVIRKELSSLDTTEAKNRVNTGDANDWKPIHEAARAGQVKAAELLLKHGADKDARTNFGVGGTALWLARDNLGDDHPMTKFLEKIGAADMGPEL